MIIITVVIVMIIIRMKVIANRWIYAIFLRKNYANYVGMYYFQYLSICYISYEGML